MQKVLSQLFVLCLMVGLSVLIMIYGWGLQPKSWLWIIGGGVVVNTALRVLANKIEQK